MKLAKILLPSVILIGAIVPSVVQAASNMASAAATTTYSTTAIISLW